MEHKGHIKKDQRRNLGTCLFVSSSVDFVGAGLCACPVWGWRGFNRKERKGRKKENGFIRAYCVTPVSTPKNRHKDELNLDLDVTQFTQV